MPATPRPSLKTSLADRYATAIAAGDKTANIAKTSDHVDVGNKIQNQFQPNVKIGVTSYTPAALNNADKIGVSTVKYKG